MGDLFKICIFSIVFTLLIMGILHISTDLSFINLDIQSVLIFLSLLVVNICFLSLFFKLFITNFNVKNNNQELITLKTASKYRREFFGNVSHELKTPIFNIQGYVETLIDGALYDKNVNIKYLKRTMKSVDRLIYIINDLESISQLESDELKLDLKKWHLGLLISEIIDQFEIKIKKKGIKIIHDDTSTDCMVFADKGKISQVISNLISNAIKYGRHRGSIKVSCHQSIDECWVSIKDNGIGIAQKNIQRLFERFYRVDKSRSREQGGTGLGLAIVKHILEGHNQSIRVKSSVKKGTEFVFSLHVVDSRK